MVENIIHTKLPKSWDKKYLQYLAHSERWLHRKVIEALNENLNVPMRDIMFRGGKRMRPLFFIKLLQALGSDPKKYIDFAYFIETIHTGTLVLDDIEDKASMRRGKPALHVTYGIDTALNTGTAMHLLPLALLIKNRVHLSNQQLLKIWNIYSEEIINVYLGQAIDIHWHKNLPTNLKTEEYTQMARLKTGGLLRMCVRIACVLTNQKPLVEKHLIAFAELGGIAFQIKDDMLDLSANPTEFGKQYGNDITEGKLSLPVIYALRELNKKDKKRLTHILSLNTRNKNLIDEARKLIKKTQALQKAQTSAEELLYAAEKHLTKIPLPSKKLSELQNFGKKLLTRTL